MSHKSYIALGSNLNDPLWQVEEGLRQLGKLPQTHLQAWSSWYQSVPMGPVAQPDFINGVALLNTELDPLTLLDHLQHIEQRQQRQRQQRWGPRTLDLDLLLYDNRRITSSRLTVPHPGLRERNFVLYPLAEIEPSLTLPSGETIESLLALCPATGLSRVQTPGAKLNMEQE